MGHDDGRPLSQSSQHPTIGLLPGDHVDHRSHACMSSALGHFGFVFPNVDLAETAEGGS
jgi:hypothetical protein